MRLATALLPAATAAVLLSVPAAPAAAGKSKGPVRGAYTGATHQRDASGKTVYAGKVKVSLGPFSDPARVTRLELAAELACDDGTTKRVSVKKVIYGPQLDKERRFHLLYEGVTMDGRFTNSGRVRGTFTWVDGTCRVSDVAWDARKR